MRRSRRLPHSTQPPGPIREGAGGGGRRIHPAWSVALVAFVALIGAAGFRAAPGVLMVPLQQEFGWPRTLLSVRWASTWCCTG